MVSVDPMLLSDLSTKLIRAAFPSSRGVDKRNSRGSPPTSIDASELEDIWSTDKVGVHGVSSSQVFATMKGKRLFVAIGEQRVVVPPFKKSHEGDKALPCFLEADVKRVYEFDFLPQCLFSQLVCVLTEDRVGEVPFSFSNPATSDDEAVEPPFKAGDGQVTFWSQGFVYEAETSGLRVDLVQVGPEVPCYSGRLCFRVWGNLHQQAELLKMACTSLHEVCTVRV